MIKETGSRWFRTYWMLLVGGLGLLPLQVLAQSEPISPEAAFERAFEQYANGLYLDAAQKFESFQNIYPNHPSASEALYYQAESSLRAGLSDKATDLFASFQSRYPIHPLASRARLSLGVYFYETQQYDRAIETLQHVVDDEPVPEIAAKALYWMGESALNMGRVDEALRHFNTAAETYRWTTTGPIALYAIAHTQAQQNNNLEAARAFELLKARYPDSPHTQSVGLALADTYYALEDYDRVVEEIERQINRLEGAEKDRATYLLAESYNQLRKSNEAIVYYRRFTESNPDSPYYRLALYGLAWNYHFGEVYQWAAEHFEKVTLDHTDELAHKAMYYQGVNQKLSGRTDQAVETHEELLRIWPDGELSAAAQFELGMSYYELRRWDRSAQAFQALIDRFPNAPQIGEGLRMQGEAFVAQGMFNEAFEAYDDAAALDAAPEELREQVGFQKAWLLYRQENYEESGPAFMRLYRQYEEGEMAGEALFWAAESYYQDGEHTRAIQLFTQFLQRFKNHKHETAAHYALGWAYFKQHRYAGAVLEFQQFLNQYRPTDEVVGYRTDVQLRLGDSFYALKRYDEAIRAYRRIEGNEEDYAVYRMGQANSHLQRYDAAISAFEDLQVRFPYSEWREEALYATGYLRFLNQDYMAAIEDYRTLIQRYPDHALAAKAYYGIADALYNEGQWDEAVAAYQVLLERYPESPMILDAFSGMQYALAAQERESDIDLILEEFATRYPESPILDDLRFRLAEIKYESGQSEEAIASLQRFLEEARTDKKRPDAYLYLGRAYAEMNNWQQAEGYLVQLVERFPDYYRLAEAEQALANLYLDQNRHREALPLFRKLELSGELDALTRAKVRYGHGMALLGVGRTEEAETMLRNVVDANPDALEILPAQLGLARINEEKGETETAISLYQKVARESLDEVGAEALYRLGELLTAQGRAEEALEELGRIPVLFSMFPEWEARGYLAQAGAFLSLGRRGDADQVYDMVIEQYPDSPFAEQALQAKEAL